MILNTVNVLDSWVKIEYEKQVLSLFCLENYSKILEQLMYERQWYFDIISKKKQNFLKIKQC
jgi:hypothetical protein